MLGTRGSSAAEGDHPSFQNSALGAKYHRHNTIPTAMVGPATAVTVGPVQSVRASRTDRDSSTEFLGIHDIEPTEGNLQRFWSALADELHKVEHELPELGDVTSGAKATLATLAKVSDIHQSVLTGNLRVLAEAKVTAFGLDEYLDFDIGGYGEDSLVRADLVATARDRLMAKHGVAVNLAHTVLIGDTPLDIEAARASGARVVAVATGQSTYDVLSKANPNVVIHDLSDPQAVLAAVKSASNDRRSVLA
jgi:phosphoglycolate phosphatase